MKNLFTLFFFLILTLANAQKTSLIKTFESIQWGNSGYNVVAAFDNKICFTLGNPSDPHDLYVSDGTPGGTKLILSLTQFDYFSNFCNEDGDYLYFVKEISGENDELMKMNKKTYQLETLKTTFSVHSISFFKDKLYYIKDLNHLTFMNTQTKVETVIKTDMVSGGALLFAEMSDKLVYLHKDDFDKIVLTASDGTAAGTTTIKDFGIDINASYSVNDYWVSNNKVFFSLNGRFSGVWETALWVTDGTPAGTIKLTGVDREYNSRIYGAVNGDYFYYRASDVGSTTIQMFRTDGTIDGTIKLGADMVRAIEDVFSYKNEVYVFGYNLSNVKGIFKIADADPNPEMIMNFNEIGVELNSPFIFNDSLFFKGYNSEYGSEFYKSDGSKESLTVIDTDNKDLNSGVYQTYVSGKYIFYSKRIDLEERELWVYDPKVYLATSKNVNFELKLFPNPSTGYINIPAKFVGSNVAILDFQGNKVQSFEAKSTILEINNLAHGTYILQIIENGKIYTSRFIRL